MKTQTFYSILLSVLVSCIVSCSRENAAPPKAATPTSSRMVSRPYHVQIVTAGWVKRYQEDMFHQDIPFPMFGIVIRLQSSTSNAVVVSIGVTNTTLKLSGGQSVPLSIFQHISAISATASVHSPAGIKRNIAPSRAFLNTLAIEAPYNLPQYYGLVWSIGSLPADNNGFDFPAWGLDNRLTVEYLIEPSGEAQFGLIFQADSTNTPSRLSFLGETFPVPSVPNRPLPKAYLNVNQANGNEAPEAFKQRIVNIIRQNAATNIQVLSITLIPGGFEVKADDTSSVVGDGIAPFKDAIARNTDLQEAIGKINSVQLMSLSPPQTLPDGTPFVHFTIKCSR